MKALVGGSGRFLHQDLVRSALAAGEVLVEILIKCCQRPLHDLLQVLVRSS